MATADWTGREDLTQAGPIRFFTLGIRRWEQAILRNKSGGLGGWDYHFEVTVVELKVVRQE